MTAPLDSQSYYDALAALAWQVELGVDTCVEDAPVNRYDAPAKAPASQPRPEATAAPDLPAPAALEVDPVAEAETMAAAAHDLNALRTAMDAFPHCELKKGARNLVFADGVPGSRVMVVGEAPGREEDIEGRPFVGRAGQLLDRMLSAISLSRKESVYITNVLPYRPPQNRDPKPEEIAMMLPFLRRHIELAAPDVLLIMGNISCQALLGKRGITRLRGTWVEAAGKPALPMFHPAYLLRNPAAKREAWADLLSVQERLHA
ncbi:MAG: uracil-DNA glycosylase [Pseudomonadota bacterium]